MHILLPLNNEVFFNDKDGRSTAVCAFFIFFDCRAGKVETEAGQHDHQFSSSTSTANHPACSNSYTNF